MRYGSRACSSSGRFRDMRGSWTNLPMLQLTACFVTAVIFTCGCGRDPGPSYRLDLAELRKIDPDRIIFRQARIVRPEVDRPLAIARLSEEDSLIVAGATEIIVMGRNGQRGAAAPLLAPATAVAAGPDGKTYIATSAGLFRWLPDSGRDPEPWGDLPDRAGLCAVAAAADRIWAADPGEGTVYAFDSAGKLKHQLGGGGGPSDQPHFILPSRRFDMAAGEDTGVWIVNPGRHRLENYRIDGSLASSWGAAGNALERFSGCCNPTHIALFPDGRFVTAEKGLPRVKIYDQTGGLTGVVCGPDLLGANSGPGLDLAVLSGDRVALLDPRAEVIRIFEPKKASETDNGR